MNEVYFENIEQIGSLFLDYVFYEFEKEPILFICEDIRKRLYLCLCSDIRYEQKWLIIPGSIAVLRSLVEEKMDIASVFLKCPSVISVVMDWQGKENCCVIETGRLDRLDLPKEGTFIRCDKDKAHNYLWRKELELLLLKSEDSVGAESIMGASVKKTPGMVLNAVMSAVMKQTDVYRNTFTEKTAVKVEVNTAFQQPVRTRQEVCIRQIEVDYANEPAVLNAGRAVDDHSVQAA